jgi:RNA polymerase sigma-70 factor (ECF subfamily)
MSIINDDAEVEELMQITYIKAYESIGKFEFKSSFSTWITRILINECLMSLKRRKKINEANDSMYPASYHHYSMDKQTPLIKVLNSELKEVLERSIQSLPEKYRIVFVMREIENMNIAETKECLGISETNVKVRLNRAKSLLRDSLSSYVKKEELLHFHLSRCDNMVQKVMDRIRAI